ncbi:MAG TPA: serine hydrolase domain-containing protein [Caulobacteraceae bacterium]|jgi:CubicO group peptidase (beta-lactamase class C family)|nr:serine hydrolase domain-containing protein [Caulobacteraceae bacterium]
MGAQSDDRMAKAVDAVTDEAMAARTIVGSVIMVSRGGELVYARAAGLADREAGTPVKPDTIFRYASLTKPIVAAAAMALVEKGLISLDDPVTKFLPDFTPRLPDGEAPPITLRQLMTHTAGLAYRFFQPEGGPYHLADISDGMDLPGRSMEDNLRRIASAPLAYPPGTAWGYSVAMDVMGAVLAKAAGKPLPEVVKERVTGPLGMVDTGFTVTERDRLATAYGDGSPEPVRMGAHHMVAFGPGAISFAPDRMFDPGSFPSAGAGMSGTAPDFMRFLEAIQGGGAPILQTSTVALMDTVATADLAMIMPGSGFGLGWALQRDSGATQTPGTRRWGGVYGNSWFADPAEKLSVVILTNTAIAGMTGPFPDAIRDAIYGAIRS